MLAMLLAASTLSYAQVEPKMAIVLLGNDEISDVNVNDTFVNSVSPAIDIVKKEFQGIPPEQAVDVYITSHKSGPATIELHSNPKLDVKKEADIMAKLRAVKIENTKIVDMPLLIRLNGSQSQGSLESETLMAKRKAAYQVAGIKEKYELNKAWSANKVLPVLAAYQTIVDDKFAGVKGFGKMVAKTDFNRPVDVAGLTHNNPDFWRAVMEMDPSNQLIPATKIFALVSQGYIDYAHRYLEIISFFSDEKSKAGGYLEELNWRIDEFEKQVIAEVEKGIVEHDNGNYDKAIAIYTDILKLYPHSAWTQYELYYSQNARDMKSGAIPADDRKQWDTAKVKIYSSSPLYNLDVRASNGREAYLMYRRFEISTLFKTKGNTLNDTYEYADIALDLEVYDFAAHLFWLSFTYEKDEKLKERSLHRYLYTLEKLGAGQWKENFKGDFNKIFKKIDTEKKKAMETSKAYKTFKN